MKICDRLADRNKFVIYHWSFIIFHLNQNKGTIKVITDK